MGFLLVADTDGSERSREHLRALVASLDEQSERSELLVITRGAGTVDLGELPESVGLYVLPVPASASPAQARSRALRLSRQYGLLLCCDVVAFPDDGSTYAPGTFEHVVGHMSHGAEVVCGISRPGAVDADRAMSPPPESTDHARPACRPRSSAAFFSVSLLTSVRESDEIATMGERASAAEPDDVGRVLATGARTAYDPEVLVLQAS